MVDETWQVGRLEHVAALREIHSSVINRKVLRFQLQGWAGRRAGKPTCCSTLPRCSPGAPQTWRRTSTRARLSRSRPAPDRTASGYVCSPAAFPASQPGLSRKANLFLQSLAQPGSEAVWATLHVLSLLTALWSACLIGKAQSRVEGQPKLYRPAGCRRVR